MIKIIRKPSITASYTTSRHKNKNYVQINLSLISPLLQTLAPGHLSIHANKAETESGKTVYELSIAAHKKNNITN